MVRTAVIGVGTLGIKIAGEWYNNCYPNKITFWDRLYFIANDICSKCQQLGYLAYRGHEVRIFDNKNTLNTVAQRISEDARICKEDGIMTNTKFLVSVAITHTHTHKLTP